MTTSRYFASFPIITYDGVQALDLTERVVFLNSAIKNPYLFYPYELTDDERADQFANRYYSDSYKSWILYLGNQIIDPYYGWYIPQDVLEKIINIKYGSFQLAQTKIKYYENNWYGSPNISVAAYDALPSTLLKYWEPIFGARNTPIAYKRKQITQTINTNAIRSYTVSNNAFIKDEVCNIVFNINTMGTGQVLSVAENTVFLQHIGGVSVATITANSFLYGTESNVNTVITTAAVVANNLLPEEVVYWSPVSYLDYENAQNEFNKSIIVMDSAYSQQVANDLKSLLK